MLAAVAKGDGWCAALAGCAALAALGVLATPSPDSGTSEELRQALVLVDILRSGMVMRRTTASAVAPATAALPPVPLPGTHGAFPVPYYLYDAPFRRFYGAGGRRGGRGERQLQYEDSFGAHPDGNDAFTSSTATSKVSEEQSSPSSWTKTSSSPAKDNAAIAMSTPAPPTTAEPTAATTATALNTHANIVTTSLRTLQDSEPPRTSTAATNALKIKKLKYLKEDRFRTRVFNEERNKVRQSEEQIEMSQAAAELRREATAGGQRGGGGHSPWRHRGTTRVHLARSSALPRPLPENNAFCHVSPHSPLCRTFI
ncbi:uncharacterized protein LOC106717039 [Papilio machaon]|uniref:uncharacterized protein LOC106717039 n=1 Tax=Papilio machaon TaxID=76193 RepID=UPI001E665741|nr:uncharacterized protein LOC106717039 [Papilio machaon]